MNIYVITRKIIQDVVLIIFVVVILYVVFRIMPGSPVDLFLHGLKHPTEQEKITIEKQLGLYGGKFSLTNFLIYLRDMFTFNFGEDYYTGQSVIFVIKQALPYTLLLFGSAAVISFAIGIPLGIYTSFKRGKKSESGIITASTLLNSIPFFVFAIIFFVYLAGDLHIFPLRSIFPISYIVHPTLKSIELILYYLAMPIIVLVIVEAAGHLLTMRAAMVSVLGEDFITTARAKGVSERGIMFHHAARNAMIPVSTRMALEFAFLMSGAVIVEVIFSIHGMGTVLYDATLQEDYPVSEGALFVISIIVILAYSAIDFIHAWLDPRIKV
ncbi:ABC transporter permease [Thermoplasma acidophilum]|nr:ABC transporter permease [Thermoplasma acidophilum]